MQREVNLSTVIQNTRVSAHPSACIYIYSRRWVEDDCIASETCAPAFESCMQVSFLHGRIESELNIDCEIKNTLSSLQHQRGKSGSGQVYVNVWNEIGGAECGTLSLMTKENQRAHDRGFAFSKEVIQLYMLSLFLSVFLSRH